MTQLAELPVHDGFLAGAVPDAEQTHEFVLERHGIVSGIRGDRIGNRRATPLCQQRRRGSCDRQPEDYTQNKIPHLSPLQPWLTRAPI
jgi:hypothetical protein